MKRRYHQYILPILLLLIILTSCQRDMQTKSSFYLGYAEQALCYGALDQYYIAGYHNGNHPEGILDPQQVKAVWIDNGTRSVLLITVDCIALDGGTVSAIRTSLSDFTQQSGCDAIHVISTHTHAGVDTLGLWGPIGTNGKNAAFQEQIITVADTVARAAHATRQSGQLYYSATPTEKLQRDSRDPQLYDPNLYQLRFQPDQTDNGVRIVSYAAHAEALRGENRLISADLAGALADTVFQQCGDKLIFLPGAIGGLIMTEELNHENAVQNLSATATRLADYTLHPSEEQLLSPTIALTRVHFKTDLDNTLFLYYKFLGILGNDVRRTSLGTYQLTSEISLLQLGGVTLALLPGEIFPELLCGTGIEEDGEGLEQIAARHQIETLIPIGLANDELGYIIPSSDFVLDSDFPYVIAADGHYEETNSVGPNCADDLRRAFEKAIKQLRKQNSLIIRKP